MVLDPVQAAAEAGLRWVSDDRPGLRRVRAGKTFRYLDSDEKTIREPRVVERIRKLAIPPAWTEVWICPSANGHIQATGRDARGRKQYRYHPRWREKRDETKYDKMLIFGAALPKIRARVLADMALPGLPRDKVLATVVRLLETTLIRVGNEEYARANRSFGLTTLRTRHVDVDGAELRFEFRGKSGIRHRVSVHDRRLARVVRRCQDLPGHELFQYIDDDGELHCIDSQDVNEYLKEITHEDITAKDFRTWNGTVLAAEALLAAVQGGGPRGRSKRVVTRCIDAVAQRLGNTKTVCRKCYVHPAVVEAYLDGTLESALAAGRRASRSSETALRPEEAAVLAFLRGRSGREAVAGVAQATEAAAPAA